MNATDKLGMQEDADDQGVLVTLPPDEGPAGGSEGPGENEPIGSNGPNSLADGGRVDPDDEDAQDAADEAAAAVGTTDADREAIR